MIELFSGTPGSGKSLRAAEKIYYRLRINKPVIANFDIRLDYVRKKPKKPIPFYWVENQDLDVNWLLDFARRYWEGRTIKEDEILLVIDEAQLIFNARDWNKPGRSSWLSFFTQHRKYGFRIILIAQFDNMLDKQIRSLIEYEWVHRKISNFGIRGKILSLVFGGRSFVAVKVWYPLNQRIGSEIFHARRKFYRLYDTFGDFGSSGDKN